MGPPTLTNQDEVMPYGIREMGLNAGNTLMWSFSLRQSRILRPDEISTEAAIEAAYFRDYSLSLIRASSARFILISDEIEQRYLFNEAQGLSPPIEIMLRGYNVVFRLMLDGAQIQRVFVVIPDPRKFANGGDWRSRQKFTEIMRLATILTKMSAINYNFFENHHAHDCIFRALVEERTSGIPLEIEQLDSEIRQWLDRKGFRTNEDIDELAKLVGSLAEGLFILLCTLPPRAKGEVGRVRPAKEKVVRVHKYSKELVTAVKDLRQEKLQKNSIYPDLEENDHDKVPIVARINVSQQSPYQPTYGRKGLEDRGESEDYPEESSDEPANIMEISLDITDELKITIAEVDDMIDPQQLDNSKVDDVIDSQQLDNSKAAAGKRAPLYTERFLHKLSNGGLFNPYKFSHTSQYAIPIHPDIRIYVPTWIHLDQERGAMVKAELVDKGTNLPEAKIFSRNDTASDTARRLAISVTVFQKNGSEAQFWAKKRGRDTGRICT